MAWQPSRAERDLELIVFGACLGNTAIAGSTLEGIGNYGFYDSDVGMLAELVSAAVKSGKPLKEDVVFAGWCKQNGVKLNGGSVVSAIAATVKENGKRRAAERALRMLQFSRNLSVDELITQYEQALLAIRK